MTPPLRPHRFTLTLLGALVVLALCVVASNASPTPWTPDRSDRPAGRFGGLGHGERISRLLVLDREQSAKVADLVAQLRGEMSPLRDSRRELRTQLKAELAAPKPDAERIGQLVLQMRSGRGTLRSALSRFDQNLSALLRPEQLARYQEWKLKHPRLLSGERGRRERGGRRGALEAPDGPGTEGEDRPL
ncbi:MAG TPA: periplasmic heavy metal sensor [Thermoanaerobaculia bacterium]|jgi:Spy/CpxP family protein refolding chaperone|nr:periplasmic heavy metal sensor [Thermoanaerobaculia bacterium]